MSEDRITRKREPIKPLPSLERLNELLDYDPLTGEFRWRIDRRGTARAGSIAGSTGGYRMISIDGVGYQASRLAWKVMTGKDPIATIDHRNHQVDDNRFCNLREATHQEQSRHRRAWGRSKYRGVSWAKSGRKWQAQININRKQTHLGHFTCEVEAARAYDAAAAEHHGEFANLNFPVTE